MNLETLLNGIDKIGLDKPVSGHSGDEMTLFCQGEKLMTIPRSLNYDLFLALEFMLKHLFTAQPRVHSIATWQHYERSVERIGWRIEIYNTSDAVAAAKVMDRDGVATSIGSGQEFMFIAAQGKDCANNEPHG